ncbi:MAG: CPXCG motif-containing cysteine-rich protein [Elusimicrobia bacterium]|nr:CPXCG motif-containing cysteine-rich protein [Elusimicrobiota bacterium]
MSLKKTELTCPYCWEKIETAIDPSMEGQSYVEDCQVCCRPIVISTHPAENGELEISASKENP